MVSPDLNASPVPTVSNPPASGLPSAQDSWDTLVAVLNVVEHDATFIAQPPGLALPASVVHRRANPSLSIPSSQESWTALLDVLNTVGYTEAFAERHPHLSVSQGVARFLEEQALERPSSPEVTDGGVPPRKPRRP